MLEIAFGEHLPMCDREDLRFCSEAQELSRLRSKAMRTSPSSYAHLFRGWTVCVMRKSPAKATQHISIFAADLGTLGN